MEEYKRDYYIARIRAGYVPLKIDGRRFKIEAPNNDTILESQEKYLEAYEDALDDEMLSEQDLLDFLIIQNLWSEKDEKDYQEVVPGHVEYWKMELYKTILRSKDRESIRKYLQTAKDEYERLSNLRHQYDYVTVEGYANYIRSMFLIYECTTLDGKKVDWSEYNVNKVMTEYHNVLLRPDDIRELARTSPWTNIWTTLKINGTIFKELTVEQQSLLTWSNMYDKIYENPDCPSDEVIQDDDMLDGWLLIQRKKREAERQQDEVKNALNPRIANADEVYIPAQTVEDAQKVDILNSTRAKSIKRSRLKQLKEKGSVQEQQFKDVQQKRRMDIQQAYNSRMRNKNG